LDGKRVIGYQFVILPDFRKHMFRSGVEDGRNTVVDTTDQYLVSFFDCQLIPCTIERHYSYFLNILDVC